eukprot:15460365-Alexandrium_andersonii.AAC.1
MSVNGRGWKRPESVNKARSAPWASVAGGQAAEVISNIARRASAACSDAENCHTWCAPMKYKQQSAVRMGSVA